jgi:hypothetical protein
MARQIRHVLNKHKSRLDQRYVVRDASQNPVMATSPVMMSVSKLTEALTRRPCGQELDVPEFADICLNGAAPTGA